MTTNDGGPAFPRFSQDAWGKPFIAGGMTLRQYAAITLRVPDSGTDWLDDMIRKANRTDFAAKAMQGMLAHGGDFEEFAHIAIDASAIADAMLREREAK